jgi:hypothetical protein
VFAFRFSVLGFGFSGAHIPLVRVHFIDLQGFAVANPHMNPRFDDRGLCNDRRQPTDQYRFRITLQATFDTATGGFATANPYRSGWSLVFRFRI